MSAPTEEELHKDRLRMAREIGAMSDEELIGGIELRQTANYAGHHFELFSRN